MTYDSWKTTPPDDEPAPVEHRPHDDEYDCDECLLDAGVCPGCGSPDECECDDGPCTHVYRGEMDGLDVRDVCERCGHERPQTLREHIEENT